MNQEITKEMYEKAANAKSAEEIMELAKAENIELTAEEAKEYYDMLHKAGEIADDELDNVSGGCGGTVIDTTCPRCKIQMREAFNEPGMSIGGYICPRCGFRRSKMTHARAH